VPGTCRATVFRCLAARTVMDLLRARPAALRDAADRDVPVLLPAGVVEYHGPHLPIGADVLIARAVVDRVAERCEVVRAPGFPFGPTASWAGGPEDGELDMPCEPFFQYVRSVLAGLQDMGFDRIHVLQHHQGEQGGQQLCLRRAGYELWAEAGRERGPGWSEDADAGAVHASRPAVGGLDEHCDALPSDHAGPFETGVLLAAVPDTVDVDALPDDPADRVEWLRESDESTAAEGEAWLEAAVDGWVDALQRAG
jgi:creatinine amidohydrolase